MMTFTVATALEDVVDVSDSIKVVEVALKYNRPEVSSGIARTHINPFRMS